MNILFVSELSNLGGGETSLLNLILEFKKSHREINSTLLCFDEGKLTIESKENQISTVIYDLNNDAKRLKIINLMRKIKNIIKSNDIDLIQTNEWKTAVIISFVNKLFFLNCKIIWVCHGQWYEFNYIKRNLINIFIDDIIAVSKNVKDNLINNNINFNKIHHIPLGIDVKKFRNGDGNKIRKELNICKNEIVFGVIGRFQEIKGQKLVIEAVNLLKEKGRKIKVVFVGDSIFNNVADDIYKKECLELIIKYNIEEYFEFLGVRRDVSDILKGIDALIVPSINESFGMVVIEAYAANCVVVSTPCDGPREIIKDGYDSFILNERSHKCLAELLEEIINNKGILNSLRVNQKKSIPKYSIEKICNQYKQIYNL